MDVLGSASVVQLNLFRAQQDATKEMRALATGLRVSSASDDPSGLAISETIGSQVAALQDSVDNVQTAANLLTVADGVMQTAQTILQRVHELAVQAHSDLQSDAQLQSIQTEIDALFKELNQISSSATFNGKRLFDGSLDNSQATPPTAHIVDAESNPDGSIPRQDVFDAGNTGSANAGPFIYNPKTQNFDGVPSFIQFQVISYSSNPVDPITGPLGQPGVIIRATAYSTDPSFGAAPETVQDTAVPTNAGPDAGSGAALQITSPSGTQTVLIFDLGNLSAQDVGVGVSVVTQLGKPAGTGNPLQVHSGAEEGQTVSIALPSLSTSSLGISGATVLRPAMVDAFNSPIGMSSSNNIAADDMQVRVADAMTTVGAARAQVGAQVVTLKEDSADNSIRIVNQIASQSSIRDADIAQTSVRFTQAQIRTKLGINVLAQMQVNARLLTRLLFPR